MFSLSLGHVPCTLRHYLFSLTLPLHSWQRPPGVALSWAAVLLEDQRTSHRMGEKGSPREGQVGGPKEQPVLCRPEPGAIWAVWICRRHLCLHCRSYWVSSKQCQGPAAPPGPFCSLYHSLCSVTAFKYMQRDPDPIVSCLTVQTFYILEAKGPETPAKTLSSCLCMRRLRRRYY